MNKAKYNEVPKGYRRDYRKEAVEFLAMFATCFASVASMVWMLFAF